MADERYAEFMEETPKIWLQSLFEESSTQKYPLGTERLLSDGRVFVYCEVGAANLAVGKLVQGEAIEANHANINVANVANAVANATRLATVTLSNANLAANAYAEGFMNVEDGTGLGYAYKVKSHPAANANADVVVTLYDKLRANLTSAHVTLVKHPCRDVIVTPAAATQKIVGVPVAVMTANYFGWIQKKGPASVLVAGTLVAGDMAYEAANGAAGPPAANTVPTTQYIGRVLHLGANTEYGLVDLEL